MRLATLCALIGSLLLALPAGAQPADSPKKEKRTTEKGTKEETTAPLSKPAESPPLNLCGCYEDSNGLCHCSKKNRCGCPGECEPTGCEDKRRKELEKEAQQELKRQREEDKKRNAELAKKRDDEEKKEAQKRERSLRGLRLVEPK
jgi:hypothetical protein